MPLPLIEVRKTHQFFRDFGANVAHPSSSNPADFPDPSVGFVPYPAQQNVEPGYVRKAGYHFLADQLVWYSVARVGQPSSTVYLREGVYLCDAQGLDPTAGVFRNYWESGPRMQPTAGKIFDGQPRLESGVQRFYCYGGTDFSSEWRELDIQTLSGGTSDPFPSFNPELSQEATTTAFGYYTATDYRAAANPGPNDLLLFEGITDSGEYDEITTGGSSSHPLGLALIRTNGALVLDDPRIDDVGGDLKFAWAWIDINTGNAVGFLDIPYDTKGSAEQQSEPNLDGNGFDWHQIQFVPDPDSLDARPKGEIHIYSRNLDNTVHATSGTLPDGTAFTGIRNYVRVFEFNPFGLGTGRIRVHNRLIFTGAIDMPLDPIVAGGSVVDDGAGGGGNTQSEQIRFHQPSNTWFAWQGARLGNDNSDPGSPQNLPLDGEFVIHRWRRGLSLDSIVQTPLGEVTTARTVRHLATVQGDFGQRIAGVEVTATLRRASTYGETFTPAGATSTYQVEAQVIDDDDSHEVWEGAPGTGTLLVEGVNYTIDYGTGTLTGIDFTAAAEHSVSYRHRSAELTPAHGSLLTQAATTDGDGVARFDVTYADDDTLVGQIDSLELVTE